jgi:hypothetical protein
MLFTNVFSPAGRGAFVFVPPTFFHFSSMSFFSFLWLFDYSIAYSKNISGPGLIPVNEEIE